MDELTDEQKAILDFAGRRYASAGKRAADIRELFGISENRYGQILGALIEMPAAVAYDGLLVNRLRRLRDERRGVRSGRQRTAK